MSYLLDFRDANTQVKQCIYPIMLNAIIATTPQLGHTPFSALATHINLSIMNVEDELSDKSALWPSSHHLLS